MTGAAGVPAASVTTNSASGGSATRQCPPVTNVRLDATNPVQYGVGAPGPGPSKSTPINPTDGCAAPSGTPSSSARAGAAPTSSAATTTMKSLMPRRSQRDIHTSYTPPYSIPPGTSTKPSRTPAELIQAG